MGELSDNPNWVQIIEWVLRFISFKDPKTNDVDWFDAGQDALVKLAQNNVRRDITFSYVCRIIVSCLNDIKKKKTGRGKRRRKTTELVAEPVALGAGPLEILERREQIEFVQKCLLSLSDDKRRILLLRSFEQLSFEEIANEFKSTVAAARMRYLRAKDELRKALVRNGGTFDAIDGFLL